MKFGTKAGVAMAVVAFLAVGGEALAAKKAKTSMAVSGVLNLNTASAKELDRLPGVGEKAVRKIVEYRAKTPFARVEDLVKVKGFGKKTFVKLKPYLTLSGPTTLKVQRTAALTPTEGRATPPKR